jgi:hypothetical protein
MDRYTLGSYNISLPQGINRMIALTSNGVRTRYTLHYPYAYILDIKSGHWEQVYSHSRPLSTLVSSTRCCTSFEIVFSLFPPTSSSPDNPFQSSQGNTTPISCHSIPFPFISNYLSLPPEMEVRETSMDRNGEST